MKPGKQGTLGDQVLDKARASDLLFPIAVFLRTGGISSVEAEVMFSWAIKRAFRLGTPRSAEQIGQSVVHQDVIQRWRRDRRFLTRAGMPRELSMHGRDGFASLVRSVDDSASAASILDVLCRYGNVKRVRGARYRLLRPFFTVTSRKAMAFEPMARLLTDVTTTLDRIVRHSNERPHLFWRMVENASVPSKLASEFISHVEERSLTFLEELDDWLTARAGAKGRRGACKRVGLGLYTIYSDPKRTPSVSQGSAR